MSINLGSTSISNAYLGSTGVTAIYLGGTQVWTSAGPIPIGANTFKLGGLGGTLTSSSLASKLTGETLTYFVSQSGDIFVSSSTNYTINSSAFLGNTSITSYVDGGRCTTINSNAFQVAFNLVSASFPNVTTINIFAFAGTGLAYVSFPKVTTIGVNAFQGVSLTEISQTAFPSASTLNENAFQDCALLVSASFPKATSIGDYAFYQQNPGSALQYINFPSASTVGDRTFYQCDSLVSASFPRATTVGPSAFYSCAALNYVSLPSLAGSTALGGTTGDDSVFLGVASAGQIYVPSYYSQSNAGGLDGDLSYLSSSLNWTINWL